MSNPAEKYLQEKTSAKEQRKANELELWRKWKDSGEKPEHLKPLLKLYEPVFGAKVRAWKAKFVPESAFKAELQSQFVKALRTYDPTRGAAINTHVECRLPKAKRYNNRYANLAYIPEGQSGLIGKIQVAQNTLTDELGRAPTAEEIGDHIGETGKRVGTILKAVQKSIPLSRSGAPGAYDYAAGAEHTSRGFEDQQIAVAAQILPDIFPGKPDMHQLFNHTFGTNGHPLILKTGDLAKKMGKTEPQISRMKTIMGDTLRKQLGLDEEDD